MSIFSSSSSSLLFSEQQTSDWAVNDSEIIKSIVQAKTTREVDQRLRQAFLGTNKTSSFQPTIDSMDEQSSSETTQIHSKLPLSRLSLSVSSTLLRRMAHVSINEARAQKTQSASHATEDDGLLREDMLFDLLKSIGAQLVTARRSLHSSTSLDVVAISDVLQAFAVFASSGSSTRDKLIPLATIVVELLDSVERTTLYSIKPVRLVQCLQAITKLDIRQSSLQQKIYERLLRPDAISKLPARFLAHGLSTFASTQQPRSTADTAADKARDDQSTSIKLLSRAFMRRLRKKKVLEEATVDDLTRALVATSSLLKLGTMESMEDEVAIFGFTSLRRALDLHLAMKKENGSTLLMTSQVVDLITSWSVLTDRNREDTVIDHLMQVCVEDGVLQSCTTRQLVSIINAVQKLDVTDRSQLAEAVGNRFLTLAEAQTKAQRSDEINPTFVNELLRWSILNHRKEKEVQRPYIEAALILFQQKTFLSRCSVAEISNFLWFLSSTRTFNEGVVKTIGSQLLDPDLVDSSSANIASRILATFTSLVSLAKTPPSDTVLQIQDDLFHSYGGHLLTSSLTPAEISSSLYAYAKASYLHDMGIFDHLVGLLASSRRVCTSRQLSQSLWSCGKMAVWENYNLINGAETPELHHDVPYLLDAKLVAAELIHRVKDLTTADISQTIWALGRLHIQDDAMLSAFIRQAMEHSSELSSGQISNILWGMAETRQRNTDVISKLSLRLTKKEVYTSPMEASSALFSLGKLDWYDEVVFEKLSNTILEQIEDTNAQSIANALWAYRTVGLPAPQKLLNTWATEKLGLQNFKVLEE
ncbi:hypothetical protein IV203_016521 [Nitzschia inconspicua]|uniref:RNA-editing substrate-binding complex 6 protein domain-containing protein n=1 Tax=Nitzschia inconspicua TaxID=303405 RepID=A0A9K3PIA5_9STRA|nr:hypothetical protein IV203_016521 [Nitzschia inconspicua]